MDKVRVCPARKKNGKVGGRYGQSKDGQQLAGKEWLGWVVRLRRSVHTK